MPLATVLWLVNIRIPLVWDTNLTPLAPVDSARGYARGCTDVSLVQRQRGAVRIGAQWLSLSGYSLEGGLGCTRPQGRGGVWKIPPPPGLPPLLGTCHRCDYFLIPRTHGYHVYHAAAWLKANRLALFASGKTLRRVAALLVIHFGCGSCMEAKRG